MSLNARRFAEKCLHPIEVPTLPKITAEDASRMPLLARIVREEHERHAARMAELRALTPKLERLDDVIRDIQLRGGHIDLADVRLSLTKYRSGESGRGVEAVVIRPHDTLSDWRNPRDQNVVAEALRAARWRIVYVYAHGSTVSRDRVVFMHGSRAVETSCMRGWVLDAIEAGLITAATSGNHPAVDTGAPLRTSDAVEAQGAAQPA